MIGQLRGAIWQLRPPHLVLGVQGVGYEVDVPLSALTQLPLGADNVVLHTHQVVRDDGSSLYGFLDVAERDLFRQLLRINGIGPRLALTLLSSLSSAELVHCVQTEDVGRLTKVPGIGRKTAERLLLELRGKLGDATSAGHAGVGAVALVPATASAEAEAALMSLGYTPKDAQGMVRKIADVDTLTTAEVIRRALKEAAR